ncbi:glycoside hydrolase family 16 protein [Subsaxibacter sp. CAU 1640]|uniref:glycoside hydrolase family 16 protein n=1 Tax=Subsaxibacter sp. CAU 1640 TaxID=2933271 RepID=UPI0020067665|nr:glycoside hydrolase family 16 protein [Subsaxibacter sp. CAU 1640]MCK7590666.1 glycoside hydrolase family 16 protein [Subsaxibacter sp. CAU 1640]
MKKLNNYIALLLLLVAFGSCQEDDPSFGNVVAPTNIVVTYDIVGQDADNPFGDGSGTVNFQANADNASSFRFIATGFQEDATNGQATILFSDQGVNTYQVTVLAFGTGGVSSSTTVEVEVQVNYSPPQDLLDKLVGDGSRTWRIKSEAQGHFGLGPVAGTIPVEWYGAGPEEKAGTGMYDDRYVFNIDRTFTHITDNTNDDPTNNPAGTVFGRDGLIQQLNGACPACELQGADVLNYPLNDYNANWQITAPGGVETIVLSGTAFMGYYTGGNHQYQIFNRSVPNELLLTTTDGNAEFNWWFIITSEEPADEEFTSIYNNLVWSDEFDTAGAPDSNNWTYDLGAGGWGNGELQTYTNSANNVIVEDGHLKITAKAEGSGYTSARLKSENLYEFTYGRVEARAKLPAGIGTWPAIWMLGADYDVNPWPGCGEIDIMEQTGQDKQTTLGALHYPGVSPGGGNANTTPNPTATTEFHLYTVEWTPDMITLLVDDTVFHTVPNNATTPFNNDFFLILNIAMGGSLGGTVDPAFTESTMEIDYVRVYQ